MSPYASHSADSKGRLKEEEQCDIRPVFQRDALFLFFQNLSVKKMCSCLTADVINKLRIFIHGRAGGFHYVQMGADMTIRESLEQWERTYLSPYASHSADST